MGECNTILCAYTLYGHIGWCCTHASIYTLYNTLKEKKNLGKHCGKGEIAQNEQFHLSPPPPTMFSVQSVKPLKATFQLSSATSLYLGRSQNGVLGNGVKACVYYV